MTAWADELPENPNTPVRCGETYEEAARRMTDWALAHWGGGLTPVLLSVAQVYATLELAEQTAKVAIGVDNLT